MRQFLDAIKERGINIVPLHTSGRATLTDLKKMVDSLQPRALIPIHTLHADDLSRYFNNVTRLENGKSFEARCDSSATQFASTCPRDKRPRRRAV